MSLTIIENGVERAMTSKEIADHEATQVQITKETAPTYLQLRAQAYPSHEVLLDGLVKLSSSDPVIKADGVAQVDKYYADCLSVKTLYPKV